MNQETRTKKLERLFIAAAFEPRKNKEKEPTNMKLKDTRNVRCRAALCAVDQMTREELHRAKYGLEFIDQPEPTNIIEPVRKVEPMTFSLANLLPVGV